ncbi:MAG: damage-control phosphatase ARMT1 family protein [Spirochaetes bacterium]|nr:damage-control phosphatase ARMT1 family protein [Spirochaetota bacterium]
MHEQIIEPPKRIMVGDPGSFAQHTLRNRFPEIIGKVAAVLPYRSEERKNLLSLMEEIPEGCIVDPFEEGSVKKEEFQPEEVSDWRREIQVWRGSRWIDLPFYFAEAYLYLRILIAVGYYEKSSPYYRKDPFAFLKKEELQGVLQEPSWESTLERASDPHRALVLMLKGNRVDLSNMTIAQQGRKRVHHDESEDLLINHLEVLTDTVVQSRRIDIVLDNAGSELICDLHFAYVVLSKGVSKGQRRVVLHGKAAPFFVSDATKRDVLETIDRLGQSDPYASWGRSLKGFLDSRELEIKDHYFWNGPCHFPSMPPDLKEQFAQSDLVIFKGDANYRRLLEDRKWPYATQLEDLLTWFPTNLAVLRTLKSEILVGISEEKAQEMFARDPNWLINGKWGIVQRVERKT